MPSKNKEKLKEYRNKHYHNNSEYYKNKTIDRKRKIKFFIDTLKNKPCQDCGLSYPSYVMDFDHRDSKDKLRNIAYLPVLGWSENKILKEIAKCDLVCSNCHRIRTHNRRIAIERV